MLGAHAALWLAERLAIDGGVSFSGPLRDTGRTSIGFRPGDTATTESGTRLSHIWRPCTWSRGWARIGPVVAPASGDA
jgi:hypothetical protein